MTTPRRLLIDDTRSGAYHLVSRCVRRAFLAGDTYSHRRQWIAEQIQAMSQAFAIDVLSWCAMSNHLHIVVKTYPAQATEWTPFQVAERWCQVYPKRNALGEIEPPTVQYIEQLANNSTWIERIRPRLSSISWFMKTIKERLARRANKEDQVTGHFWEGRFTSVALLDQAAVIAAMAYVDLNPIRAKMATTPETSDYTSIQERIWIRQRYERAMGLRSAAPKMAPALIRAAGLGDPQHNQDGIWTAPLERCTASNNPLACKAITVDDYLELVDTTGRIIKNGKRGKIPANLKPILERLQIDTNAWIKAMTSGAAFLGTAIGSAAARIKEATRRGVAWIVDKAKIYKTADPPPAPA